MCVYWHDVGTQGRFCLQDHRPIAKFPIEVDAGAGFELLQPRRIVILLLLAIGAEFNPYGVP
jgi:hypothetical protein